MATDNVVPFNGKNPPPPGDGAVAAGSEGKGSSRRKKGDVDWDKLDRLTDRFAMIYSTDTVWDEPTGLIMKISAMAHAVGSSYVSMWKSRESTGVREPGSKKRWMVLPSHVVFDPTKQCDPLTTINLYNGLEMQPAEGDVAPMLQLGRHLCSRASDNAEECEQVLHWLLCWMAYPLQKPGAKMRTAVVMHGDEGAGKNVFFETYLEIFGEYGKSVGQDELDDKFNDWRSKALFVVADEASSRQELVHNKNRLKALITSPTVQINPKNLPRREESNHMNIVFLSNELQPLALDNTDRRYLVVFTPPAREDQFYIDLAKWRTWGGAQAWMSYLLKYPIGDFNPYAPAPVTSAKRDLIELNRKTPERFWLEWSADELALPYRTCSVDQAYRAYNRFSQRAGDRYPVQKPVFSRMLLRISDSMKKPVRVKTMRVSEGEGSDDRATRMLLVADPVLHNGVSEREWASAAVLAFERDLRKYLHAPHSPESGDEGQGHA